MQPEKRISRGEIKARNIYRISTYKDGDPPTKTGENTRYVFVIGRIGNKIHTIKLNEITPINFTNLLFKLRDIRVPIGVTQQLSILLKTFSRDGSVLFEQYIKASPKIYGHGKSNYRIYKIDKIQNVWEIRFDTFFLKKLFKEDSTPATREPIIKKQVDKQKADDSGDTISAPK